MPKPFGKKNGNFDQKKVIYGESDAYLTALKRPVWR
jgi:hypothetical protein